MDKIIEKINGLLGESYRTQVQNKMMWVYKDNKVAFRIDLNYALEMDKRNELENYLNTIIK